ncbi:protein translocase subunit SecF [Patescibacteria group bacterium]
MKYSIVKNRKWWFVLSGTMILASIVLLIFVRLRMGIDFVGGSIIEVKLEQEIETGADVEEALSDLELGSVLIQPTSQSTVIIRVAEIGNETQEQIVQKLRKTYGSAELERFESVGPTIGEELRQKAIYAMIIVLVAIVAYIAYAFRKVSAPIQSWKYGVVAIATLLHDVIIMSGLYVLFGVWFGAEVGSLFIVALLTVLGYSVNDTIVVFDRVRENLSKQKSESFGTIVEKSIRQTITRSLNTSITTGLVLVAILIFGGGTIRDFIAALLVGVLVGTYSSIFFASPLLVAWEKWRAKRKSIG